MRITKVIVYIILIAVILVLAFTIYSSANQNEQQDQKEKTMAEIEFLETRLVNLFNTINNIQFENYNISVNEIKKEASSSSSQSSSSSGGGSSSESSGKGESSESSSSGGSSSKDSTSTSSGGEGKKFTLNQTGVLTNKEDINWDSIKNEIETMYEVIPTITIDLYQINLNQEDILAFNNEIDKLTSEAKNESKSGTLQTLLQAYEYIPKFAQNATDDKIKKTILETKTNIFRAYIKLDDKKWNEMKIDIQNAIDTFVKLISDSTVDDNERYNINKVYVILNELQNAVTIENDAVFLIKYKNLLEELNNI